MLAVSVKVGIVQILSVVLGSLWFAGCQHRASTPDLSEKSEPLFQKAQQCLRENRSEEAFKFFQRLSEQRPRDCPETHFELGQLYLGLKKDPIFAIYHFRQYLLQAPEGKFMHLVLQMIETAKKEFARSLPLNDRYNESPEYLNLVEVIKQIRQENNQLKNKLMRLRLAKETASPANREYVAPVVNENVTQERIYVVQNEDSLSKISLKMYGSAVKWNIIYNANRDVLPSANSLKIGMKLRIPPLKAAQK